MPPCLTGRQPERWTYESRSACSSSRGAPPDEAGPFLRCTFSLRRPHRSRVSFRRFLAVDPCGFRPSPGGEQEAELPLSHSRGAGLGERVLRVPVELAVPLLPPLRRPESGAEFRHSIVSGGLPRPLPGTLLLPGCTLAEALSSVGISSPSVALGGA